MLTLGTKNEGPHPKHMHGEQFSKSKVGYVIVNFICHLGWATGPRYLVMLLLRYFLDKVSNLISTL